MATRRRRSTGASPRARSSTRSPATSTGSRAARWRRCSEAAASASAGDRRGASVRPLSRAQIRDLDRQAVERYGIPSLVLMENAGRGAADTLVSLGIRGPVLVCCGKGNNGGDGLVLARHLLLRGFKVTLHLFA